MTAVRPSCILAGVDDKALMCGAERKGAARRGAAVTLARWVQAHVDGHGGTWCPDCMTAWVASHEQLELDLVAP